MKRSSVRARIRQLCCLGVPGELLVGPLLPALRELIPSRSAAFLWFDSLGEVRNLYAEHLPAAGLGPEDAVRRSLVACMDAPDEIAITDSRVCSGGHVLCALASSGSSTFGQVRLYRDEIQPPFTGDDRITLASVMHYVSRGVAHDDARAVRDQLAFAYEDTEEEALLVTDPLGTIHFASESGMRLLLLATASAITPAILRSTMGEGASRAIKAVCARLEAAARGLDTASTSITLDSCWGRFVLRGYRLKAGHGSKARIGLRIQRQLPMILRFVEALGHQDLSPQQREIALRVALGLSNQEISERLGVSLNTVAYHLKQIFLRLDVHTRTEAIEKIAWGAPRAAAGERSAANPAMSL